MLQEYFLGLSNTWVWIYEVTGVCLDEPERTYFNMITKNTNHSFFNAMEN